MSHWYTKEGDPLYTIISKDGIERNTTLRDARKLNLVPSVTTIIDLLDKPGLTQWKLGILLKCAQKETDIENIWKAYKLETERAAKEGSIIHNKLEQYFKTGKLSIEDEELLLPVVEGIEGHFTPDTILSEQSFSSPLGYGGQIDLVLTRKDKVIIIDFKTKEAEKLDKTIVYSSHKMQLAAYREAINKEAECYNMFISTTHSIKPYLHKHDPEELDKEFKKFKLLLDYWKLHNNYEAKF